MPVLGNEGARVTLVEVLKRLISEGAWEEIFKLTPKEEAQFRRMCFEEEESRRGSFTIGE